MYSLNSKSEYVTPFSCNKLLIGKIIIEVLKVRTIKGITSLFVISIGTIKVVSVILVNQKFKYLVRAKYLYYGITILNLTTE